MLSSVFRIFQKTGCQFQALVASSFLFVMSQSALKTSCIPVASTNEIQTENFIAELGATGVNSV